MSRETVYNTDGLYHCNYNSLKSKAQSGYEDQARYGPDLIHIPLLELGKAHEMIEEKTRK